MNATAARARSELYRVLAGAFDYPDAGLREALAAHELHDALERLLSQVSPALAARFDAAALATVPPLEELAADYSALFDVGSSGKPPCPLYGGAYGGVERLAVMEEVVRFYDHFGLRTAEAVNEMPDALGTQLEFLHFLAGRQADVLATGGDAGPFVRAEHDFLERHPGRWVPQMRARLDAGEPSPLYRELVRVLDDSLQCMREQVTSAASAASVAAPARVEAGRSAAARATGRTSTAGAGDES